MNADGSDSPTGYPFVLRQPGINVMSVVAGAICAFLGLGALLDPEFSPWMGWAVVVVGVWSLVSSMAMAVTVTADDVLVRSYMGWRRVPRQSVRAVRRVSIAMPRSPDYLAPALVTESRTIRLWPLAVSTLRRRRMDKVEEWCKLLARELGVEYDR